MLRHLSFVIRHSLFVLIIVAVVSCAPAAAPLAKPVPHALAVPVLMYHEITTIRPPSDTVITPDRFTEQMQFLADHHYHTLTIPEFLDFLKGKPVPENSLVLTFDDGWTSVAAAFPILKQHNFNATFFIITGAADGNFGPDYLSWNQIESLSKEPLFDIAAHSVTHPWNPADNFVTWSHNKPAGKSIADVRRELVDSKKALESHLHKPIVYWAWPCGWYTPELVTEAQNAGYQAQFSTLQFPNVPGVKATEIRRFFIQGNWDIDAFSQFLDRAKRPYSPSPEDNVSTLPN